MIIERWAKIVPCLSEFQHHLAPHIPILKLEQANDRMWSEQEYREQCRTGIFERYGVYVIFAPDESLEYVGIAMNRFHNRIWSHDDHLNRRWTDVISLPREYYWLGPALEFFLIVRLQPPKNSVYKAYAIPELLRLDQT